MGPSYGASRTTNIGCFSKRVLTSCGRSPGRDDPHSPSIAPLLLAAGIGANAEICIIPTDDVVQARTAKCLLSIDGMLLVDDRCNFRVSPDGHRTTLDAGKHYAEVNVTPRGAAIGFWNRGIGRRDRLTSLGLVTRFDSSGAYCYHNRRFEMCASDYLTCKCGPNELYGCMPAHAD